MSNGFWIGCDIAKETFWIALAKVGDANTEWSKLAHREFEHSKTGVAAFEKWLEEIGVDADNIAGICLEATGRLSLRWALLLEEGLGPVCIVNPAAPKAFAASLGIRDKTDRVDACVCAMFGRMKNPAPTKFRSPCHEELREQFRCYQALESQRIANEQRLHDGPSSKSVRTILRKVIKALERQIATLEAGMDKMIAGDPGLSKDAEQAKTVTGIGNQATRVILSEFGDLRQYKRNELIALAGLFPKEFYSGTSVRKRPRMAKGGGGRVRRVLYMCAMSARAYNPHIKRFAQQLERNGKAPMQVLGAIMRKLLLLVRAVVISGKPYDPGYGFDV